jgi:hypothetical protein
LIDDRIRSNIGAGVAMAGLIEEIQRDAFDHKIRVSALLRKVKAAASKLNLPPTEDWVEQELNGYRGISKLPEYRVVHGSPKALNPYNGWIPIVLGDEELDAIVSTCHVAQSIASIESLLEKNETNFVQFPLPPKMIVHLNSLMDIRLGTMAVHVSTSQVDGLLDAVRNVVLEWALKLEKAGITGEGMSFNPKEKQIAAASTTFNIGSIGSMVGNLGSNNVSGDINASDIVIDEVRFLVDQLEPHVNSLKAVGVNAKLLESSLVELKKQTQSGSPDQSKIKDALSDLRNALSGAMGSLVASGALALIAKIFGG